MVEEKDGWYTVNVKDARWGSLGPTRSRCLAKLREIYLGLGGDEP